MGEKERELRRMPFHEKAKQIIILQCWKHRGSCYSENIAEKQTTTLKLQVGGCVGKSYILSAELINVMICQS